MDAGQIATDGAEFSEGGIRAHVNNAMNITGNGNYTHAEQKAHGDAFMKGLSESPISKGIANASLWLGL